MDEFMERINASWEHLRSHHDEIDKMVLMYLLDMEGNGDIELNRIDQLMQYRAERAHVEEEMISRANDAASSAFHGFYWNADINKIREHTANILMSELDHASVGRVLNRARREYYEYMNE